jgi:hypothetical protein
MGLILDARDGHLFFFSGSVLGVITLLPTRQRFVEEARLKFRSRDETKYRVKHRGPRSFAKPLDDLLLRRYLMNETELALDILFLYLYTSTVASSVRYSSPSEITYPIPSSVSLHPPRLPVHPRRC